MNEVNLSKFAEFITSLNKHAQTSEVFFDNELLQILCDYFGFPNSGITIYDRAQCVGIAAINRCVYLKDIYFSEFSSKDYISKYISNNIVSILAENSVVRGSETLSSSPHAESAIEYDEYLKRAGLKYVSVLPITRTHRIVFYKGEETDDFTESEYALLHAILLVIKSSYRLFVDMHNRLNNGNLSNMILSSLKIGYAVIPSNQSSMFVSNQYMATICKDLFGVDTSIAYVTKLKELINNQDTVFYKGYEFRSMQESHMSPSGDLEEHWSVVAKKTDAVFDEAAFTAALQTSIPLNQLTERELDVMDRFLRGDSWLEISKALFISEGTVKAHIKNIYRKLGISNQRELAYKYGSLMGINSLIEQQHKSPESHPF